MKHFLISLVAIITLSSALNSAPLVYKFNINTEINSTSWLYTKKAIEEAKQLNASLFLIEMNTYGGEVVYADSIRTALLNLNIPTAVFINKNAASAGALISIACDSIYMVAGSTIGATTVVSGTTGEKATDKYQSYMRATMRATAESHGKDSTTGLWHRNPAVAEAMVDENNSIDSGRVLTLTAKEAVEMQFCEQIVENTTQILLAYNIPTDTETVIYQPSNVDKIKGSLLGTALRSMLIMLIFGGIFYELKTPGIGFPLLVAIIAAILYFTPLFIDGLASYWEVFIFAIGIILISLELFVIPGFGITGISGIILIIIGLTFSLIDNDINLTQLTISELDSHHIGQAAATVLFGIIGSIFIIIFISTHIGAGGLFSKLALHKEQTIADGYIAVEPENTNIIGQIATTYTDLRPSGKILINNKQHDAISTNGYIQKDTSVKIIKMQNGNTYVDTI